MSNKGQQEYAKNKKKLMVLMKTQIGCASIHTPDHGMKQNLVGGS